MRNFSNKSKLHKVELPILFVGTATNRDSFMHTTGLKPLQVHLVNTLEGLYGYRDRTLFYGYGFSWILKDETIMSYCRQHNIKVHGIDPMTLISIQFIN